MCRCAARLFLRPSELGADLVGTGMLDVVIDGQCPLPRPPGLWQVADGVACVADVGKELCFIGAVAVVPAQGEREFEMGSGPVGVAMMKLDLPESVPDVMLEVTAAEFGDEGQ